MQLLLETVIPVFALMAIGWGCRKSGMLDAGAAKALNQYVFYIAIPPLLFLSTARVSLAEIINWPFLGAYFAGTAAVIAVALAGTRWLNLKGALDRAVVSLIASWGNTVYMGVPLFYFLFGDQGTLPVVIVTLSTNMAMIFVLALCAHMDAKGQERGSMLVMFNNVFLKNPVMLAPILGMLVSYFSITVPTPLENLLNMIAPSAAPVALFAMGLSLYGLSFRGNMLQLTWMTAMKLLVQPVATLLVVLAIGMDPFWAASAVLLAALPAGSMVYVLAQQYDTRVELASSTVLATTMLSLLSLALLLPWIKSWVG